MASALKVLGQLAPNAGTLADLYTVPAATQTAVSSVVVCNRGATDTTFRLAVSVAGATDATKQYLYYDQPLAANDTFIATIGIGLGAADVLRVQGGSANLSFSAFGEEVS